MNRAEQTEIIQLLKDTNAYLKKQNEDQQKQIQQLSQNIANLNETVRYLNNKIFGLSSEKIKSSKEYDVNSGQLNLFNEIEISVDPSVEEPSLEIVVEGYTKQKRKLRNAVALLNDRTWNYERVI